MNRLIRSILTVAFVAVSASDLPAIAAEKSTTKPATSTPSPKPAKKTGPPAELTKAIADLNKEFMNYAAKPDSSSLRQGSDFWQSGLPADVTADDVLSALEKGMSGSATQVAYVKWQLTSGLPSKLEGAQAGRVFNLYRNAPQPMPAFSADPRVAKQLDRAVVGMKEGQEDKLNTQLDKQKEQVEALNAPILGYRDALYSRLPTNSEVLIARLQDGVIRVQNGIDLKSILSNFKTDVNVWVTSDATPQQANNILAAIKEAERVKGPEVYKEAKWDEKRRVMDWTKPAVSITSASLDEVEKTLKEYIANPKAGGLKFK